MHKTCQYLLERNGEKVWGRKLLFVVMSPFKDVKRALNWTSCHLSRFGREFRYRINRNRHINSKILSERESSWNISSGYNFITILKAANTSSERLNTLTWSLRPRVSWVPCHHVMTRPQVVDWREGLQICRVAANNLISSRVQLTVGCPPAWG